MTPHGTVGADLVVRTSAAGPANPEVDAALARGIPVVRRSELLGHVTSAGKVVAVAGTHGKSTVTAWIAHVLGGAGVDVTLFGGAFVRTESGALKGPAWGSSGDLFVVEADEYDRSFLSLHPSTAVVTGVEFDHPDCYPDLADMMNAYEEFLTGVDGTVIVHAGSETALRVASASGRSVETYGSNEADWRAENIVLARGGASFEAYRGDDHIGQVTLRVPGRHNVDNALAALAAASVATGLEPRRFLEGLSAFGGLARRLELKGEVDGVSVIDDYAHHPAEILAAIRALEVNQGRLRILFQPHTYSRTKALRDEFVQALLEADEVILLDVYAAREDPIPGVSGRDLADRMTASGGQVRWLPSAQGAIRYIVESSQDGDVVVTMGAGDVTEIAPRLIRALEARDAGFIARSAVDSGRSTRDVAYDALERALGEVGLARIRRNELMSRHTSWRIGGPVDLFAVAGSAEALSAALRLANELGVPCLVLGGGSNILVADEGIEGLVVLNRSNSVEIGDQDGPTCVEAGSGLFFARLATFTAHQGLAGLEWGVAIPGTVGAGMVNDAGAHHGDVPAP